MKHELNYENQDLAAMDAAGKRVAWMKSAFGQHYPKTKKWRIRMDFDESGELIEYWEAAMDRAGNELFGSGISRVDEPTSGGRITFKGFRLSALQVHALLAGLDHKLTRSLLGWLCDLNGPDEPAVLFGPATIKSLWRRGLFEGNFNDSRGVGSRDELKEAETLDGARYSPDVPKLQVWTSDFGKEVLEDGKEVLEELGLLPRDGALH